MKYKGINMCIKCPQDMCTKNKVMTAIYNGINFDIFPSCANGSKFSAYLNSKALSCHLARNYADSLLGIIKALLEWSDLHLEDYLNLLRIKNESERL